MADDCYLDTIVLADLEPFLTEHAAPQYAYTWVLGEVARQKRQFGLEFCRVKAERHPAGRPMLDDEGKFAGEREVDTIIVTIEFSNHHHWIGEIRLGNS